MTNVRDKAGVPQTPRQSSKSERSLAGRGLTEKAAPRKPTGPVTYSIEKGANIWPSSAGRK